MNSADQDDYLDVHELLSVAVSGVQRPAGASDGELITRGRRIRRRRRAVGAASLAVVAAAACTITLVLSGTGDSALIQPAATPVASSSTGRSVPAETTPVDRVRALLPAAAGELTKVSTPMETSGNRTVPEPRSALNGRYTLRKAGTVGYLEVDILDPAKDRMSDPSAATLRDSDMCVPQPAGSVREANYGCTTQELADGSQLKTWVVPAAAGTGISYAAQLVLPDGRKVGLIACSGNPAYGPLMSTPPLTSAQLAALVRQPGWFSS